MQEESLKETNIILGILLTILIGINSLAILFIVGVARVDAQTQTGIYLKSDYSLCSISNTSDKTNCITGVGHPGGVTSFATNINQIGFFMTTNDYTLQANTSYTIEYEYRLTIEKDSSTATIPNPTGMYYVVKNGYRNSSTNLTCSDVSWSRIASTMGNGVYNAIFHLDCTITVGSNAISRFSINNTIESSSTGALFVSMTPLKLGITKNATSQNQQDVINNQNQNTQNIIINNNSNTNKIMENNNNNTQKILDYGNWTQQNPDETTINNAIADENQIGSYLTDSSDITSMNIEIDTGTNIVIWDIFNRLITGNTLLYSTFLTILFFGLIKTAFAR